MLDVQLISIFSSCSEASTVGNTMGGLEVTSGKASARLLTDHVLIKVCDSSEDEAVKGPEFENCAKH